MLVRLDKVLGPGQTCSYEYDYGTTTELKPTEVCFQCIFDNKG